MFVWKCTHSSIGVKDFLARRGIALDTTCPLCHREVETITHALRDCHVIKNIWFQLGIQAVNSTFFTQDIGEWLVTNGSRRKGQVAKDPPWDIMFLFAIWLIWNQRNHVVFKNNSPNPRITKEIARQATEFFHCANQFKNPKIMITRQVHWEKPDPGWMKLNTNGASNSHWA